MGVRRTTRTTRVSVASDKGVFMISVAAELAEMHPQTLRMYEQRGLIQPKRSPKGTRLYSQEDVERLRRIQEMTAELGLNLAGVERVMELEAEVERLQRRVAQLEDARRRQAEQHAEETARVRAEANEAISRARADAARARAELVRYEPPATDLLRAEDAEPPRRMRIPVERRDGNGSTS